MIGDSQKRQALAARGGALLINKDPGITSFGVVEELQRSLRAPGLKRKDLPKIGHGGTLDPFATGLLVVCVGRAVKLAQYFLGSKKRYTGTIRFGETTIPGDPTEAISERSEVIPNSLETLQNLAHRLTLQPYLQTPPMHSAKKKDGKPLYELARQGIEVEREPKLLQLDYFQISELSPPLATFDLQCSSGTYVRTLAQDFARMLGSVALLERLHRTHSGAFNVANAWKLDEVLASKTDWNELPCWIPFDLLLDEAPRAEASETEAQMLLQGQQSILPEILGRIDQASPASTVAIYCRSSLIAVAHRRNHLWELERVFV